LILSVLNFSLKKHLQIFEEKSVEILFLKSLLFFADYRNDFSNGKLKYTAIVKDKDIAKIQSCSDKTIANQRDQLLDHMKSKRKAVMDFIRDSENQKKDQNTDSTLLKQ
jgi:hypothetical protein